MRAGALMATVGALALGLTGIAAAAPAELVLSGTTAEGAKVKLTVTAGEATAFKIGKTAVTCDQGGTLSNKAGTYTDFDNSDPGSFADKRSSASDSGGYHFKTKASLDGQAATDATSWTGHFKLVTKVFQKSRQIDTCKLKTTWDAS